MRYQRRILASSFCIIALASACEEKKEPEQEIVKKEPAASLVEVEVVPVKKPEDPEVEEEPADWWMDLPWDKTIKPLHIDKYGKPTSIPAFPKDYYKIRGKTKETTKEIHRQIARHVGLDIDKGKVPKLAKFLSARSSIETSMQGNQRPFDTRGLVHGLDVSAAHRAGERSRDKYVEAGNELAKNYPNIFLSYGQGGMNSWLFLSRWDIKGDPRMLGDSVISGLTYRRSLSNAYSKMKYSKIRCFEYNDEGREKVLRFNGESYNVGARAVDEEKYKECIEEGSESKSDDVEKRCYLDNRKSYRWKPGEPQPENTVPVPEITWWYLKQATNGKPCPAWKKDTYAKHAKKKFRARAKRFGLDIDSVVKSKDLGTEPNTNQYELWMDIWDSTMESMGEKPINWENIKTLGYEEPVEVRPTKAKIKQEKRRK